MSRSLPGRRGERGSLRQRSPSVQSCRGKRAASKIQPGTSLVVQWLRLHASNAGGAGSIPGRGTKIPHTAWHGPKIKKTKKTTKQSTVSLGSPVCRLWGVRGCRRGRGAGRQMRKCCPGCAPRCPGPRAFPAQSLCPRPQISSSSSTHRLFIPSFPLSRVRSKGRE